MDSPVFDCGTQKESPDSVISDDWYCLCCDRQPLIRGDLSLDRCFECLSVPYFSGDKTLFSESDFSPFFIYIEVSIFPFTSRNSQNINLFYQNLMVMTE